MDGTFDTPWYYDSGIWNLKSSIRFFHKLGVIHGHGNVIDPRGPGGGHGAGRTAGHPAPLHAADAQARHLPGAAVDPGAATSLEEATPGQELAAAAGDLGKTRAWEEEGETRGE